MTQKQIFLKNIVDSTMSISLDQSVSVETLDAFHFNNKAINEKSVKFEYTLKNSETKYFFMITFYKTSKKGFFGSDKSQFYLIPIVLFFTKSILFLEVKTCNSSPSLKTQKTSKKDPYI